MMLFDTHTHYDDGRFDPDRTEIIASLPGTGVKYITNIGTDLETSRMTLKLTQEFPFVYGAVGYHPHEARTLTDEGLDETVKMLSDPKIRAMGEIGLDYHYDFSERADQRRAFARQLEIAKALDVPVVIHEREALGDLMEILRASGVRRGVVHCFSHGPREALELVELGFHISFTGVVTFPKSVETREAAASVPEDMIMAETDCPYLAPVPFRGKRNHSGYLKYIVEKLGEARGISFEEAAHITFRNAMSFYGISE